MKSRWLFLLAASAVVLICAGILCLFWPSEALDLLPKLMGVGFVCAGSAQLFFYFFHHRAGIFPCFGWLAGLATLATGAVFLLNQHVSALFFGICCGFWAVIWGGFRLYISQKKRLLALPWKLGFFGSILHILLGSSLLLSPFISNVNSTYWVGALLILVGVGLLYGWYSADALFQRLWQAAGLLKDSSCSDEPSNDAPHV